MVAYNADHAQGYAYLAMCRLDSGGTNIRTSLVAVEAFGLFVDLLFAGFPFRKLYMEAAEYNLGQFDSLVPRVFEVEGCLREHQFLNDKYWDLYILATTRERWADERHRLVRDGPPGFESGPATSTER